MQEKGRLAFILSAVLFLGFASESELSADQEKCSVSIVVLNKTDRSAFAGAEVALRYRPPGHEVFYTGREQDKESLLKGVTGPTGTLVWAGLSQGLDYYVVVRAPGFSSQFLSVKCESSSGPPTEILLDRPIEVSLIQLIANPSLWDNRFVRVMGFLQVEFEGTALYVTAEDWKAQIDKNAIWVDFSLAEMGKFKPLGQHYVIMEGVFDATSYGHMGMFSGEITKISRCERWRWAR